MSTYWGYRCKADGATSDTWFNHGEHILRSCARCFPLIKQLWALDETGYLEVGIMAHEADELEVWAFLRDHLDHGIELYNEYGRTAPLEEASREP
jgi:hypothetical protein